MKIFVSDSGNVDRRQYCQDNKIGLLMSPHYATIPKNPKDHDIFIDNGAFSKWDKLAFYRLLDRIEAAGIIPYGVVIPDVVGRAAESLKRSAEHIDFLNGFNLYFAVQDGMKECDIKPFLDKISGIFIGGSIHWKWSTAHLWIKYAHENGLKAHIGRVGTPKAYSMAASICADSVDGSNPMRNRKLEIIPKWRDDYAKQKNIISEEEWRECISAAVHSENVCNLG